MTEEFLERYLAGDASPEERAAVQTWAASSAESAAFLRALQHTYRASRYSMDLDTGWATVATRLSTSTPETIRKDMPRRSWRWLAYTGGALSMMVIGAVVWKTLPSPAHSGSVTTHQYATGTAQRGVMTLPDGSRVELAPQTRLRYSTDARGTRTLDVSGEAYFVVTHREAAPFRVRAGRVTTTVLGTAFSVRHYEVDSHVQVAVAEGKVASQGQGDAVVLTPGMTAQFADSGATVRQGGDPAIVAEWARGRLVFTKVPVPEMLETLGRWYGYEFQLADSILASQHVSAVVAIGRPAQMVKTLKALLSVTVTVRDSVVVLRRDDGSVRGTSDRMPARVLHDSVFLSQMEKGK